MKNITALLDPLITGMWGVSALSLIPSISLTWLSSGMSIAFTLVGILYVIFVKIPHEIRASKSKKRLSDAEARKAEMENSIFYKENEDDLEDPELW